MSTKTVGQIAEETAIAFAALLHVRIFQHCQISSDKNQWEKITFKGDKNVLKTTPFFFSHQDIY